MHATGRRTDAVLERSRPHPARYTLAGAWAGLIFALSSIPGSGVPGRFGTIAHFLEYLVLAALIIRSFEGTSSTIVERVVLAVSLATAWAATDELHQAFVPLRTPDPFDWLVDAAGALTGSLAFVALAWRGPRSRSAAQ